MERRWFILADDLTGAADCAIAFAKRRLPARVVWGDARPQDHADVVALAFDAATRGVSATDAARRHADALRGVDDPQTRLFKKIDSTLRGHFAEELAAMLDVLKARASRPLVMFAPAYPAMGRTTRNGSVHIDGVPLERSEFWPAGRAAEDAGIVLQLQRAGVRARLMPLRTIRVGAAAVSSALADVAASADPDAVWVGDAETDADLDVLAVATLRADPAAFFIGSGGLAHALARVSASSSLERGLPTRDYEDPRGALILVGSQASASRAAADTLPNLPRVRRHSVEAGSLAGASADAHESVVRELAAALESGSDVLVDFVPAVDICSPDASLVIELARRFAAIAAHASALVATGGDTAAALLARCNFTGIDLLDEIEPGIPLGLTLGGLSLPIVTKAGGFGDEGSLRRIVERLRLIRQTGTLE